MADRARVFVCLAALLATTAAACFVDNHHRDYGGGTTTTGGTPVPTDSGSTPPPADDGGAVQPMLVEVDPNRTLTATPGDGVGVFVEYRAGGHWHVWWTCDTNKTQASCAFTVSATLKSGSFANAAAETDTTKLVSQPQSIVATSTTAANADGMIFDTTAGATITLDVTIGDLHDGSFIFFVQNGQVNGGFTGHLTDPLMLQPTSP